MGKSSDRGPDLVTGIAETRTPSRRSSQLFTLALSVWTAALLFYLVTLLVSAPRNSDQSWYLYAAQRMLAGARLYGPQLVETNPPLIIWFSALPVFLARLLHLDAYITLKLIVFLMIGASTAWTGRILRAARLAETSVFFYLALSSVVGAEFFLHGCDFGQREHLLVILILPYIFSAALSDQLCLSFAELCSLGLAAGAAVCFKPQHVIILAALELFLAVRNRSLRRLASPAFICAVFAVLAYIAMVRLAAPLYFSAMLPLLRSTYWTYGPRTTWGILKSTPFFDFLSLATLIVFITQRRKLRCAAVPGAFLASGFASFIAFCIQHGGWAYQAYPQDAFLFLAIFWIAAGRLSLALIANWKPDSDFAVITAALLLLLLPPLIISRRRTNLSVAGGKPHSGMNVPYPDTVFAQYPAKTPVYIFSTLVIDAFPAVFQNHLVWASRFPCLWMLPAIVRNELAEAGGPAPGKVLPPAAVQKLAALQRTETAEDFRRWKPQVVIVRQCHRSAPCFGLDHLDFDPLAWFLQSPAFAAEWKSYRLQTHQNNFDVYTRVP